MCTSTQKPLLFGGKLSLRAVGRRFQNSGINDVTTLHLSLFVVRHFALEVLPVALTHVAPLKESLLVSEHRPQTGPFRLRYRIPEDDIACGSGSRR